MFFSLREFQVSDVWLFPSFQSNFVIWNEKNYMSKSYGFDPIKTIANR